MTGQKDEMRDVTIDLGKLLAVLQTWVWLLVAGVAVGAIAAYIFSRTQTPVYEASTNILVTRNSEQTVANVTQPLNLTQLVEMYVRMLSMDDFLGIVSERVDYEVTAENVKNRIGVVSFTIDKIHPHEIAYLLDERAAILVRSGDHCCIPLMRHLGLENGTVRASLYLYNTLEEVDLLIETVEEIARIV